jgi:hypothetical protein
LLLLIKAFECICFFLSITVFNMIFEWLFNLCTPHTYNYLLRSLSRAGNFKHKDQGGFPMPRKVGHRSVDG